MKPIAIYIHIPFCVRKCAYCDFASFEKKQDVWKEYFEALLGEIDSWKDKLRTSEVRSVFFGGGTPSLVPAGYIADVLARLRQYAAFAPDCEITLEANPGTLTPEKLETYRGAGINRLSIGVQSFDAGLLKTLGRIHSPEEAEAAVYMAREAGFGNISIDLMYALPGQTMGQWLDTLKRAAQLPLKHISAYSLIVEAGTEMHRRVEAGEVSIPDDDSVNEMQRMAVDFLAKNGFARYEISNYARPGFESRHNITYWEVGEYLGLGSAAHSLLNNERFANPPELEEYLGLGSAAQSLVDNARFANPPELERYLAGERRLDCTERSVSDRMEEHIMLETRMLRGLNLAAGQANFGEDFLAKHARAIRKLENYGLIEIDNGFLRLRAMGLELQDSVVLELLED